jgi:predicted Zn-dependent protease
MSKLKTHLISLSLALSVALALFSFAFSSAHAWTHEINNWDNNPNDFLCGKSQSTPCLYWAQPSNTSINLYAYFDPSLNNARGNYNFTVAINRAFGDWNAQKAWNPYLNSCGSSSSCLNGADLTYTMSDLGYGIYGATNISSYGTVQWNSKNGFWYAAFFYVPVYFNTEITWNNSLQFSNTTADGRKVSTHECGHALGLGHTGHTPAIMRQGMTTYYAVQTDDLNGLQNVYPGYYPGSTQ